VGGSSNPATRLPVALIGLPFGALLALIGAAVSIALLFGGTASCGSEPVGSVKGAPAKLIPIYRQASARYGLGARGPAVLAAINKIETGFGANMGPSSAGAQGWMQFMPATWAAYGVDANGDGRKDPADPSDAIFAAARYLQASGAPGDWHRAIFAYNHAEWYVEDVLAEARRFQDSGEEVLAAGPVGCAAAATDSEAVARMVAEAERIDGLRLTYVYGGSHGSSPAPPGGPFDCSSAVSRLLQVGGFGNPTMTTAGLISWGEAGPGRQATIHVKPYGADAHTFIEFRPGVTPPARRYWGTSRTNPGGGPGWIAQDELSASYLAGFQPRHPPGL
jgi:hypothetical protein